MYLIYSEVSKKYSLILMYDFRELMILVMIIRF
jgi:hypothetical protein